MRWHARNKNYYIDKGYVFTKMKDRFLVKIEDLPLQSHAEVQVKCDYCGKIYTCKYQNYNNNSKVVDKDCCYECHMKKVGDVFEVKYGNRSIPCTEETKEKQRMTIFEHYGVYYSSQCEEIKQKIKETTFSRYGAEHYSQTEEYKEKMKKTNLEKRGVEFHTQDEEVKKKNKETQEKRYLGMGLGSPIVGPKIRRSLYKNGTAPVSKPQLELFNLLKEIYGICELNYPVGKFLLDCMLELGKVKINVEFDGEYWHNFPESKQRDCLRDRFMIDNGYKVLRVLGNTKIPEKETLIEAIDLLQNTEQNFIRIVTDINDKTKI